ncbi:vWA domain-containing protein [Nocardioides sp. LHG3406-4]|uniref:vWA domain-containing protein n=1 Tax=Nocardioides sp. LHG3406-4 TaxID=2804575 RepID=UPI003CE9EB43
MTLLDTHIGFLEALRAAGVPVSLAEGLDAIEAVAVLSWDDRETVRTGYAATMVKRVGQRAAFDAIFDLYFPRLVGDSSTDEPDGVAGPVRDGPEELERMRDRLLSALESGDESALQDLATEAVGRFGAMRGRGPGLSSWSAYTTLQRVSPGDLVQRVVDALVRGGLTEQEAERGAGRRLGRFTGLVEGDARRRIAAEKGARHMAEVAVRPTVETIDFTSARRSELDAMRREILPLARRLATRLTKERHARRRGPLDFRRTVRASISTGGVPVTTHHRPRRPHRAELVVLCDVSGSVANFAQFTLLLVFALQEQFSKVRAFTFVDQVHEVTGQLRPGADPGRVLADLAASTAQAARWGRTDYGRALALFAEEHSDALGPKTSLLILGDARSNYSDLAEPVLRELAGSVRHAWWLNPEHARHWGTGDSAAPTYAEIVPMVECRNLTQLAAFVHDLV